LFYNLVTSVYFSIVFEFKNTCVPKTTFDSVSRFAITARMFVTGVSVNVDGSVGDDNTGEEILLSGSDFAAAMGSPNDMDKINIEKCFVKVIQFSK
jgi:hypothetical protein